MNNEELNFRKVMQRQISQKAKPIAIQYGLKPAKRNSFVLERDNLIFHWIFCFDHSYAVVDRFEILPIYAPIKGDFGDGFPLSELIKMSAEKPYVACSTLKYFASEAEKEEVIKKFDVSLACTAGKLHYCNELDSFEKYIARVHQNIAEMPQTPFPIKLDDFGKYILGVYDCMQQKYDKGREKLNQVLAGNIKRAGEKGVQWLLERTLDEIGNTDRYEWALHYKFTEMFVQALDKPSSEREECFKKTYEIVCNRMRKFYGIKVS